MIISTPQKERLDIDVERLARELERHLEGEVRFDDGSRALYATDASNYRQVPVGVVLPKNKEDAIAAMEICRRFGVPITSRGAGTSLAGQCCNVAVILDLSKYMYRVLELDPKRKIARVEPGVVLDQIRHGAAMHNLTFGSDTSTHEYATIGGSIGNNACGIHSILSGRTSDNVCELEIVTYDGLHTVVGRTPDKELAKVIRAGGRKAEIYQKLLALRDKYGDLIRERFPDIPRRVSGYNLDDLLPECGFHVARALTGSEGTCALMLEATMNLVYRPPYRTLVVLGYPDIYTAADHVPDVMERKPVGLEAIDSVLVDNINAKRLNAEHLRLLPEGQAFLLAEFGGETQAEATRNAQRATRGCGAVSHVLYEDEVRQTTIWKIRESGLGATARVPALEDTWEGWEDSAVAPEKLGNYLRDLRKMYEEYDYKGALYGHFGQGCVHTRVNFGLKDAQGIRKFRSFLNDATDLVVRYKGSYSGEHGDGQSKAEFLHKLFGKELVQAFREFKGIWDPGNKMNPGKVVDPYLVEENLRLGPNYNPRKLDTAFSFPDDEGNIAYAMERCVGVGKCRRTEEGTMCPSYMATREEKHSTRGRARLFFEMLQGEVIGKKTWRDESVKDALDLCLSCKACKSECPMNVDMATYKAEFLHHYHKGHLRPVAAYSMGLIFLWARLATAAPSVANFLTQAPIFARLSKLLGGVAPEREMPRFAERTFKQWYRERQKARRQDSRPEVILWPDTFNNYFHPETAIAAAEVLDHLGFQVLVPQQNFCCGRPLYDFGMLSLARQKLRQILSGLRPQIRAGTPIIGLEPSCVSVFRDELPNLFPGDQDAHRLSKCVVTFAEFLARQAKEVPLPQLHRKALVHMHCHHRAVMKLSADEEVFKRIGLDYEVLDSGCCGMAGAFGFEEGHYEVSVACAERVLLPKVKEASRETLILSDGFSCRQQIEQLDGRRALHLAQVLQMAHHEGPQGPSGGAPEEGYLPDPREPPSFLQSLGAIAGGAAAAGAVYYAGRKLLKR